MQNSREKTKENKLDKGRKSLSIKNHFNKNQIIRGMEKGDGNEEMKFFDLQNFLTKIEWNVVRYFYSKFQLVRFLKHLANMASCQKS